MRIESLLWRRGISWIAGVDEAGRGAWAGPVVAAAVVLPNHPDVVHTLTLAASHQDRADRFPGIRDSKQLSRARRVVADGIIRKVARATGVGVVPSSIVDDLGIVFAGQLAFWRAVCALPAHPDYLIVDGFPLWSTRYPQTAVIDGDARCVSVAAASILAKVARDRIMADLDEETPGYGFAQNCGYGTAAHARALTRLGVSCHHRRSYQPVAAVGAPHHV